MDLINAIILAVIEGITEFLPISSTGHMIIASSFMGISENEFTKLFTVCIQLGAILSVVVLYWKRFFQTFNFYYKLVAAFIPAAVFGLLFDEYIDSMLGDVRVVAFTLVAGGIFLLFVDKIFTQEKDPEEGITYSSAIKIGLFQCVAMIPGVSRSAASIIGGMSQKLTRKTAAEFSFFLAVPTMFGATAMKLLKNYKSISREDIDILLIGNLVAFIVAMLAIKFFINFLSKHGFKLFGWYRIIVGTVLLALLAMGVDLKIQ